ncbi:hypothetical protein [Streptomyces tsukubensis]|uniref:hypothetical protein n=1 Tax=Streptomyces tsukubensis TaxID=83656 RepID=UPI00344CB10A
MIKHFVHHITSEMVSNCDVESAAAMAQEMCPDSEVIVTQGVMDAENARLLLCLQADLDDRFSEVLARIEEIARRVVGSNPATP